MEKKVSLSTEVEKLVTWLIFIYFVPAEVGNIGLTVLYLNISRQRKKWKGFFPPIWLTKVIIIIHGVGLSIGEAESMNESLSKWRKMNESVNHSVNERRWTNEPMKEDESMNHLVNEERWANESELLGERRTMNEWITQCMKEDESVDHSVNERWTNESVNQWTKEDERMNQWIA